MRNPYATTSQEHRLATILAGCAASNVTTNPLVPRISRCRPVKPCRWCHPRRACRFTSAVQPKPSRHGSSGSSGPGSRPVRPFRKKIGKHYAGRPGNRTMGAKWWAKSRRGTMVRAPTPSVVAAERKFTSGKGVFSQTQSIQRLYTVGGKAPAAAGCNRAQLGKEARVPTGYVLLLQRQALRETADAEPPCPAAPGCSRRAGAFPPTCTGAEYFASG